MNIIPILLGKISDNNTKNKKRIVNQNINNLHSRNYPINNFSKFHNGISFQKLLPNDANIKMAFFDIDETLKHWNDRLPEELCQQYRNKLFNYIKAKNIQLAYSSDRGFENIMPLIEDGSLATPHWIVGNNGGFIYKNKGGKFQELKTWNKQLTTSFKKDKVRDIMIEIANKPENMFPFEEWSKIPSEIIPKGQNEFRGSKITEYVGHDSPTSMRFAMAPGMYQKNIKAIRKELKNNGIDATTILFNYPGHMSTYDALRKYFDHQTSLDIQNHYIPRSYPNGSNDTLLITSTDKGKASEHIRKTLGLSPEEIFAAGDGENDFSHANKGYYFALISNAAEGLRKMIGQTPKSNIISTTKPGAEGILEVLV